MNEELLPTGGERPHRRPGWTEGRPIFLADGSPWYGPRVTLALLITDAPLLADLGEAVKLAIGIQAQADHSRQGPVMLLFYEAIMRRIAVRLLQVNYDLPGAAWAALVAPELPGGRATLCEWVRRSLSPASRVAGQLVGPDHLGQPVNPASN